MGREIEIHQSNAYDMNLNGLLCSVWDVRGQARTERGLGRARAV